MDESKSTRALLGDAAPSPKVDRDLAFARVEQRLLGRALTPVHVGRFVVLRRVGHGGMGVVYAAHDPELDRKVAIKVVDDGDASSEAHEELVREARAAAGLSHPNVVTVFEVGLEGGAVFLAMEFVDGPTLRGWLTADDRTWREIVALYLDAGRGLSAAHDAGLVHRDFKPDNVLIGEDGRPRVADFGLARPAPQPRTDPGDGGLPSGDGTFTSIAGTPRYMAPEQHEGRGIGPASDQFAFCVALYEALFDRHPFEAKGVTAMALRVTAGDFDPPGAAARGIPAAVVRAVMRGLALDPEQRHPSMQALLEILQRALRRRRRAILGVGALGVATIAGLAGYQAAPQSVPDPCVDAAAPMEVRWSDEARQAVTTAFVATERPGAQQTAALAVDKLDRYAAQWSRMREQSCRDAQIGGQSSELLMELGHACLDRRLAGMGLLVDRFVQADAKVVGRASRAVDELAPLSRCEDRGALLASRINPFADVSDRTRPGTYDRWSELFQQNIQAEVLRSLGRSDEALEIADEVATAAHDEQLRAVEAAALGLRGRLRLGASEYDEAEADLRRATTLSLAAGRDDLAAEALVSQSRLIRERRENVAQATVLLDVARGLVQRNPWLSAFALRVAVEQARVDRLQRRFEAARDGLVAALAEADALGPDHSLIISARNDLAANLVSLGELAEAERIFAELLPREIAARGPHHRSVGTLLINLGVAAHNLGREEAASSYYEQALELYERREDAARTEMVRFRLGVLRRDQQRLPEATALLAQVLVERGARKGPEHADLAEVLEVLADVERLQGDHARAIEHARRAVELLERAHGPDYLDLRAPLVTLGKTEIDRERFDEAAAVLERAHALVYATEVDGLVRAEVCFDLARAIYDDPLRRERSLALVREAATLVRAAGPRAEGMKAEIDAWIEGRSG